MTPYSIKTFPSPFFLHPSAMSSPIPSTSTDAAATETDLSSEALARLAQQWTTPPTPWQTDILAQLVRFCVQDTALIAVGTFPHQVGKTTMAAMAMAHLLRTQEHKTVGIVANSTNIASAILKRSLAFYGRLFDDDSKHQSSITTTSAKEALVSPAGTPESWNRIVIINPFAPIVGTSLTNLAVVDFLFIDEAFYIPPGFLKEMGLLGLRPKTIMLSTMGMRGGWFDGLICKSNANVRVIEINTSAGDGVQTRGQKKQKLAALRGGTPHTPNLRDL